MLRLGSGFSLVGRGCANRMIDRAYPDLLFYNRIHSRLWGVEICLGSENCGYQDRIVKCLRWLEYHERRRGEGHSAILVLCTNRLDLKATVWQLSKTGIAEFHYASELPARSVWRQKLWQ